MTSALSNFVTAAGKASGGRVHYEEGKAEEVKKALDAWKPADKPIEIPDLHNLCFRFGVHGKDGTGKPIEDPQHLVRRIHTKSPLAATALAARLNIALH